MVKTFWSEKEKENYISQSEIPQTSEERGRDIRNEWENKGSYEPFSGKI